MISTKPFQHSSHPYFHFLIFGTAIFLLAACNTPCEHEGATPATIIQQFKSLRYEYKTDRLGGLVVPDQAVIYFEPDVSIQEQDDTLTARKMKRVKSCPCDSTMVLAEVDGSGDIIEILESTHGSGDGAKVQSQTLNHYLYDFLDKDPAVDIPDLDPNTFSGGAPQVTIAILDTGTDWQTDCNNLHNYIWKNGLDNTIDQIDNDTNGLVDDIIGWDFVDDDNNPWDEHGHGTHVAGIVAKNLNDTQTTPEKVRFIIYRVLDKNGVGNIFDISCATYCAAQKGARVFNYSFGWYGEENSLFSAVRQKIDTTFQDSIIYVASAGNDGEDMGFPDKRMYPACYAFQNVIAVAATKPDATWWPSSNFSPTFVDIAAPGDSIISCAPGDTVTLKSGTSMAAPFYTAQVAYLRSGGGNFRDGPFNCATTVPAMSSWVVGGLRFDNTNVSCLLTQ